VRGRLVNWHTAEGDRLTDDEKSADHYRAALEYAPDSLPIHHKLRDMVIAANPIYLIFGFIFLIGAIGLSSYRRA
jgi:hypothetical protein